MIQEVSSRRVFEGDLQGITETGDLNIQLLGEIKKILARVSPRNIVRLLGERIYLGLDVVRNRKDAIRLQEFGDHPIDLRDLFSDGVGKWRRFDSEWSWDEFSRCKRGGRGGARWIGEIAYA